MEKQGSMIPPEVWSLAQKPYKMARSYRSYCINGCTYHTYSHGLGKATQCYGVSLVAKTSSYASVHDKNPALGEIKYYGRVTQILELNYSNEGQVVLFRCDWVKPNGFRTLEPFGIEQVNFNHVHSGDDVGSEPFVLASQVQQVYYVQDPVEEDWSAVICPTIRDFYDMEPAVNVHDS
jgi:hypothetical protein